MKPFLPVIVWAAVIFYLSIDAGIQMPASIVSGDKLGHLLAYGLLNWLVLRALVIKKRFSRRAAFAAILFVTAYGIALEFVQLVFYPNRYFEYWDMVANFTGALLSYLAFIFISFKHNQHGFRS